MELLKIILLGIVEGITEWLPISSTGHMILVNEFIRLSASKAFEDTFFVLVQLGAIMAVVAIYWKELIPFSFTAKVEADRNKLSMWSKILLASVPAGIVGILWDQEFTALFYNYQTVAAMLILFGLLFLWVEKRQKNKKPSCTSIAGISYSAAFLIGIFQMIAAIFPGTSRSGATILGALLIGISRTAAAEFTFFLAIPAMLGASLIKIAKHGLAFSWSEMGFLLTGMAVAYIVSVLSIRFLVDYIKTNDFKAFGWYRIVLGCLVFVYFFGRP